jgi:hypothetical protein
MVYCKNGARVFCGLTHGYSDVKVFVGLYQVLTGTTVLAIAASCATFARFASDLTRDCDRDESDAADTLSSQCRRVFLVCTGAR